MMKRLAAVAVCLGTLGHAGLAQGTKLWTQSRYDEMERGTAEGVAIRSDGRLVVAPANQLLYTTNGTYVWSIASDSAGKAYLGRGGTAAGSAIVTRVAPDGTATDIFAGKELAVQALAVATDGTLFAATSPDGKVYRIEPAKSGAAAVARVIFDPAQTTEKPKYLWDLAIGKAGELFVAAGAPAVVYRVPLTGGKAQVLFRTSDQHIRCLLAAPDGTLFAGSDSGGVIYRIDPAKPGAAPFALYAAARREITGLALDSAGNLYAAGVGAKGNVPLPNLPVTGGTGVTVTFVQPGSATAATNSTVIPDGSEIYKIAADGTPSKLLTLKDDVVYALTMHNGSLLAATGNRGRVYRVDTAVPGRWTDLAHLDASQAMAFAGSKGGLLISTSNSGRVFRLSDAGAANATYTSAVFDAQIFSQWGRAEVLPASLPAGSNFDFYVRSGNVENPSSGWSDWVRATPNSGAVGVPGTRYAQWKAVLHGSAAIDSVGLNYLAKNIAPVVDEVVAQPGARIPTPAPAANLSVSISFPAPATATPAVPFQQDPNATPLIAQKDRTALTVRWAARDDNGDDLLFAVYYKGEGESNWRQLKDKISDRAYSFDMSVIPDGTYTIKVVASDSPVHTDAAALTGEKVSGAFVVDTTAPVPGPLTAAIESGKIHARFEAKDATSPISHAEYSVDAGSWQYLEPVGNLSDSLSERYDFFAAIPPSSTPVADANEHVIAIRVYDRYENVVTAKAVVR
jgi:sugar lactone lactonase YvrE